MNEKKGMLGGIQRFSTEDGPGIRTTLFFKGCPLNCKWCHNPELISRHFEILYSPKRCIGCGSCMAVCKDQAISKRETVGENGAWISIDRDKCIHCTACAKECPTNALRVAGEYRDTRSLIRLLSRDKDFYEETGGGITFSGGEVMTQPEYAEFLMDQCLEEGMPVTIDAMPPHARDFSRELGGKYSVSKSNI